MTQELLIWSATIVVLIFGAVLVILKCLMNNSLSKENVGVSSSSKGKHSVRSEEPSSQSEASSAQTEEPSSQAETTLPQPNNTLKYLRKRLTQSNKYDYDYRTIIKAIRSGEKIYDYEIRAIIENYPTDESVAILMELIRKRVFLGNLHYTIYETYPPQIAKKIFIADMKNVHHELDASVLYDAMDNWPQEDVRELLLNLNERTKPYAMLCEDQVRELAPELLD